MEHVNNVIKSSLKVSENYGQNFIVEILLMVTYPGELKQKKRLFFSDVDECATGQNDCDIGQRCENTMGSYTCRRQVSCGTGYSLQESSQVCVGKSKLQIFFAYLYYAL